jgi:Domain of unknown function (DUF4337)
MEEMEDPTEKLKELQAELLEKEHEVQEEKSNENWMRKVALTTAIIAVFAAIAGLEGNHLANEALLEQLRATDQWAFYQSKSIKYELTSSTVTILKKLGDTSVPDLEKKKEGYAKDKEEIKTEAEAAQKEANLSLRKHVVFSWAVTIFQIAIAISATAIITKRKLLWYLCLALALAGVGFAIAGFL